MLADAHDQNCTKSNDFSKNYKITEVMKFLMSHGYRIFSILVIPMPKKDAWTGLNFSNGLMHASGVKTVSSKNIYAILWATNEE